MSDNKRVLPISIGMPLYWVYDSSENPIIMKDSWDKDININQLITKFVYKDDEENDDECTITIQVTNPNQLNHPEFITDNKIKVRWGYVTQNGRLIQSPMRTVAIRDINTTYKDDAIELILVCTDLVAYIKARRTNYSSVSDNYQDWIQEVIEGKFTPTKTVQGKVTLMSPSDMWKQRSDTKIEEGKPSYEKSFIKQSANVAMKQSSLLKYDHTQLPTVPTNDYVTIKGSGSAIGHEIQKLLDSHEDGPAYLSGKDDNLNILVRNWNQAPVAVYTYAGGSGEIIEFKPKTNIVKSDDQEIESNYVNPDTKKIETTKTAVTGSDHGILPEGVNNLDIIQTEAAARMIFNYNVEHPNNQLSFNKDVVLKKTIKADAGPVNKSNLGGTTRVHVGRVTLDRYISVPTKAILNSPLLDERRRQAITDNFLKKKVERKFEAQARFIGDPSMIVGKIYLIKGLSDRDNGNWYATTISHEFDPSSGYICNITFLRKPLRLATLMEKREYPLNQQATSEPIVTTSDVSYPDLPPEDNSLFSADDMISRINNQVAYENNLKGGNDVLFNSKEPLNNIPVKTNSEES